LKEFYPNYYDRFRCIADRCSHNCCIGWEIDIDEDTLDLYNSLDSDIGDRIRKNIDGDPPHFVLQEGDRCPFLNSCGLCDIISEYGENALCDICYLHPRFRNFYSDCIETGLGASCEEAARIILGFEEKFTTSLDKSLLTPDECALVEEREHIISHLQNRDISICERLSSLAFEYGLDFDLSLEKLCDFFLSLERLDEEWTGLLSSLRDYSFNKSVFAEHEILFEQMAVYFVFRHMIRALDTYTAASVVGFALVSLYLLGALFEGGKADSVYGMAELFRMYSSEIEYSEENTEAILMSVANHTFDR